MSTWMESGKSGELAEGTMKEVAIEGREIRKIIVVPQRIVNVVA